MIVFLICEDVDLGYLVHSAYTSYSKAMQECAKLNADFANDKIKNLIKGCNYSFEEAKKYVEQSPEQFFIEECKVIE
jgi:hypothetical protein